MAKPSTPKKQHRILVPIDFSEQSVITLGQACGVAKVTGADIILINIIEDLGVFEKYFSKKEQDDLINSTDERLSRLAQEYTKKHGVKISYRIERGKIYDKINEFAELNKVTIIVMGTSGSMKIMKFIGSNTLRVIRESKVPVISIHGKHHREGCKNILLPIDLTKETRQKVAFAIELSKFYGGSTIRICTILTTDDEFIVNKLSRQLSSVKKYILDAGVPCEAEVIKLKEKTSIAQLVLEYSKKVEADLIMIMTQQELRFASMFIGSTAQEIVNQSEIPVMSIVPKEFDTGSLITTPF